MLGVLPAGQAVLELLGQFVRGRVAGHHGVTASGHDRAQVAQVELVEIGRGRFGPVEPLGHTDLGQQLLGQSEQAARLDLGLAGRLQLGVLLLQGLANRRDATAQHLLSDHLVVIGQGGQQGRAVGAAGPQALRLRTGGQLGYRRPRRAGRSVATGAAVAGGCTVGPRAAGPVATGPVATGPDATRTAGAARAATAVAVGSGPAGSVGPVATVTVVTAGSAGSQHLGDGFERPAGADQFEPLGLFAGVLARKDLQHGDAVEVELGLGSQDVTDLGTLRKLGAVKDTLGFTCSRSAPRPRSIGARTGELEVDPSRHEGQTYWTGALDHH